MQKTHRVIISGGRDFVGNEIFKRKLERILSQVPQDELEIVSGGAQGADTFGERYAQQKGLSIIQFPPNWKLHGRRAGYVRHASMVDYATHAIIFWNGYNRIAHHLIELAKKQQLSVRIIRYDRLVKGRRDVTDRYFKPGERPKRVRRRAPEQSQGKERIQVRGYGHLPVDPESGLPEPR